MAIIPIPTDKRTPASIPTVAKALGMLRDPRAMASTIKHIVNFFHPSRWYFSSPSCISVPSPTSSDSSILSLPSSICIADCRLDEGVWAYGGGKPCEALRILLHDPARGSLLKNAAEPRRNAEGRRASGSGLVAILKCSSSEHDGSQRTQRTGERPTRSVVTGLEMFQ